MDASHRSHPAAAASPLDAFSFPCRLATGESGTSDAGVATGAGEPRVVHLLHDTAEVHHNGAVYLLPTERDDDTGPRCSPAVSVAWGLCSVETCEELAGFDDLLTEVMSDRYMEQRRAVAA